MIQKLKSFHPEILKKSNHILRNCKNADIGNQKLNVWNKTSGQKCSLISFKTKHNALLMGYWDD